MSITLKEHIESLLDIHGSYRAVFKVTGIDAGYLHKLASGVKTTPSKTTLNLLGLRKIITYEVANKRID